MEASTMTPSVRWDTNTAVAVVVGGAVLVLVLLDRGFRGFTA